MRFSLEKKFVYLAYPKTGSTSVRKVLDPISDHKILVGRNQYHDHWTSSEYKQVFERNGWDWGSFYSFMTIRNPWDKYVSNFFYSKPDSNFRPWYEKGYDETTAMKHSFNKDRNKAPHGCPSLKYFAFENGNLIVDDIFTIEEFKTNALPTLITKKIIEKGTVLPYLNTTSRKGYREYYSEEVAELLAKFCEDEITFGNYIF
jgi:hypothetical protein